MKEPPGFPSGSSLVISYLTAVLAVHSSKDSVLCHEL